MPRSKSPQNIEDFIALLQDVKQKYGNLQVRRVTEDYINDPDEYAEFSDIMITTPAKSLIRNEDETESCLIFVL